MPKRALLLVNAKSRNGTVSMASVTERLQQQGISVLEESPERPGEIPELIMRHSSEVDTVVVGGGDGSVHAAASVLRTTGLALGILPLGTANDLARTLQIPSDIAQATDVIANGIVHRIDLGCVNGHPFFNVANIGLGVNVRQLLTAEMKKRWGAFSYALCVAKAIREMRPFRAEIRCEGRRRHVRSLQIAVGNGRHYGGGMTVSGEASIDDGRFHLYSIAPLRWWDLLRMGPVLRSGEFGEEHPVYIEHGRELEIITRRTMPVTADGEPVGYTPARFTVLPKAISVIVPATYLVAREQQQELDNAA